MLYALNQNYSKILKKLPNISKGMLIKLTLYLLLISTWGIILLGTYISLR